MVRIFRAKKMLDRIAREGKEHMLDDETRAFILSLDGAEGNDYNYRSFVYDEPLVWIEKTDDHEGAYVNVCDCEWPVSEED